MGFRQYVQGARECLYRGHRKRRPPKFRRRLEVESLEAREAPVVGAFAPGAPLAPRGGPYDGVVTYGCSGALLFTGRHILTAQHCLQPTLPPLTLTFQMIRDTTPLDVPVNVWSGSAFQAVYPGQFTSYNAGYDIAVLRLTDQEPGFQQANRHLIAPFGAQRYGIYTGSNEVGQVYTTVGYGGGGIGATGATDWTPGVKRWGTNRFRAVTPVPPGCTWANYHPTHNLLSDFDDGTPARDTLGDGSAMTVNEASIAPGDSGGPAFIGNLIAGINGGICGGTGFGAVNAFTRVSPHVGWINSQVGGSYHLVLDMNQQVLGNDGLIENLTITARRNGANVELWVNGPSAAYSGLYYSAPVANLLSLTIRGSADHETITLEPGLGLNVTVNGRGGNDTINVRAVATGTSMTVNGGIGNDIFTVGVPGPLFSDLYSLGGIQGALTVHGDSGNDVVNLRDNDVLGPGRNYTLTSSFLDREAAARITYGSMEGLVLYATNYGNIINIQGTAAGTSVTINAGNGNDAITIGQGSNNLASLGAGLTINGGAGSDTLTVNDQAHTAAANYTLAETSVFRWFRPTIYYGTLEGLTVNSGSGGNTWAVTNTAAGVASTVNTGTGIDTANVLRTTGALTVHGQSGRDTVNIGEANRVQDIRGTLTITNVFSYTALSINNSADTAARNATLGATGLTGLAPAAINWVENDLRALVINGGAGGNTFTVTNTPRNGFPVTTTLNAGAGSDTIHVQGTAGPLAVNAGAGSDTIHVTSPSAATMVNAGAGDDTLVGPDAVNVWGITGTDSGNLNGGVTFASVENLIGGTDTDTYVFGDGQGVSGYLYDQGGSDALDYSAYTSGVYVWLLYNYATGAGLGVYGVEYVLGGSGDDLLRGDAVGNYLAGGPGNDVLLGNEGDDVLIGGGGRDLLIGGLGADWLEGGEDQDLLIGGITGYDEIDADLLAIRDEWVLAPDYAGGVSGLRSHPGVPLADGLTVFADGEVDWLYGETQAGGAPPASDWFFIDLGLDLTPDLVSPPEEVN